MVWGVRFGSCVAHEAKQESLILISRIHSRDLRRSGLSEYGPGSIISCQKRDEYPPSANISTYFPPLLTSIPHRPCVCPAISTSCTESSSKRSYDFPKGPIPVSEKSKGCRGGDLSTDRASSVCGSSVGRRLQVRDATQEDFLLRRHRGVPIHGRHRDVTGQHSRGRTAYIPVGEVVLLPIDLRVVGPH